MSYPWKNPPAASFEFSLSDYVGCLAFFVVGGLQRDVGTTFGERDAVRAAVVLLDGPEPGKEFEDILIFNARPVMRLRNSAGEIVLARIALGVGRAGNNAPVELVDADTNDHALAARWWQAFPHRAEELRATVLASHNAELRRAEGGQRQQQSRERQPNPQAYNQHPPAGAWSQPAQRVSPNPVPAAPPPWAQQTVAVPPAADHSNQAWTPSGAAEAPSWQHPAAPGGTPATREEAGF